MAELLAPAGNVEALDAAIGEGADAVYLGLKSFNARSRSTNFAWNQFEAAVQSVHRQGKKIFVTVNTVSEEREMERLYRFLAYLEKIGPDAIIVQDFGVIRMVQEFFPKLTVHSSTQMNVASSKAVNLLSKQGVSRVVLARELGLDEIKHIRQNTSAELEVFVHGALCVSESGLCLFSSYLGGKSANRGMCTQACRRIYTAEGSDNLEQGYFFSPGDLQLVEKIPDLVMAGVDSFKIEGRMKSAEYVGSVTAAYRYVLDHWQEDKKGAIATGQRILSTDFARAKTSFWYDFKSTEDEKVAENVLNPHQAGGTGIYLGTIDKMRTVKPKQEEGEEESTITSGTLFALVGKTVGVLQINEVPGLTFKAVLNKYDIPWQEVTNDGGMVADKVNLLVITGPDAVGTVDADYFMIAEPAASAQAKKGYAIVGDLQMLYSGINGYPQAVLVAKKSLVETKSEWVQDFASKVEESAAWLYGASGEEIVEAVSAHMEDKGTATSLKAPLLSTAVLGRCGIRFSYAAACSMEVEGFLSAMLAVNNKAVAIPSSTFYWEYLK